MNTEDFEDRLEENRSKLEMLNVGAKVMVKIPTAISTSRRYNGINTVAENIHPVFYELINPTIKLVNDEGEEFHCLLSELEPMEENF